MIQESSAGIVIYRQLGSPQGLGSNVSAPALAGERTPLTTGREYLLLQYPGGHFDFAKGHIEKGETEREAAYRELKEETGLERIVWIEGFREKIHYFYSWKGQKMSKNVIFFLARTSQKKIKISFEHKGSLWLPYKEAYNKVTFETAKNILKKAEGFLRKSEK